ncbi:MAG: hypothetical protein LBV28_00740 [Puniceicoccales bacterium]|jgi:hypothetical protein|nr:hypothetical protein [Puniceicoccales bacterium]
MSLRTRTPANGTGKRTLTLRERTLAAAFLWVIALATVFVLSKQYRAARAQLATINADAATQEIVLEEKDNIATRLNAHVKRLESAQSLQGTDLQGLVERLARDSRINPESVQPTNSKAKTKDRIQIIAVRLTMNEVSMDRLLVFDDHLRAQPIPLAVTSVRLDVGQRDGLRAVYDIATYRLREQN